MNVGRHRAVEVAFDLAEEELPVEERNHHAGPGKQPCERHARRAGEPDACGEKRDQRFAHESETIASPRNTPAAQYTVRQRTNWLISMIGSRTASTIISTTAPMTRIIAGSSNVRNP